MFQAADFRYALRLWKRYPSLVLVAGLSLGLGVGATTTMYSVVNNVSHYPLNFREPDRLAVLWTTDTARGGGNRPTDWETVQAVLQHGRSFEAFGFFQGGGAPVTLTGVESARVEQMPVDGNGLAIVGVPRSWAARIASRTSRTRSSRRRPGHRHELRDLAAAAGQRRRRHRQDDPRRRRAADRDRGDAKRLPALPWEDDIAFWAANDLRKIPKATWMIAVGQLKPGVGIAAAQSEAAIIARQIVEGRGEKAAGIGAKVELLHDAYFRGPATASASCSAR